MPIDPHAARIGTAARHRFRHRCNDVLLCLEIAIVADPAGNAAHRVTLSKILERGWPVTISGRGCNLISQSRKRVTTVVTARRLIPRAEPARDE
jgi:hypothetical protein